MSSVGHNILIRDIRVERFGFVSSPAVDDLIPMDSGLESEHKPNCWGLTVPTIKDRDFLVRFDVAGNEEFCYEVLNVTRNRLFLAMEGQQTFSVNRISKTDPIYQVPITYDTAIYPQTIISGSTAAIPAYPAHSHSIQINENISSAGSDTASIRSLLWS